MIGNPCMAAVEKRSPDRVQDAAGRRRPAAQQLTRSEAMPAVASDPGERRTARINLGAEDLRNGLAQLVLALVKLLHELLEKQAIRRIEAGGLSEAECERIGFTLMKQSEQLDKLRLAFGFSEEELNLDLGPLGRLL